MRTPSDLLRTRSGHSVRRWVRVLASSLVVATLIELLLPLAWNYLSVTPLPYSSPFLIFVAWVLIVILLYVAIDALRIRPGQRHFALRYPPLWSALPVGVTFAALSEQCLPPAIRPQAVAPSWYSAYPAAVILTALAAAVLLHWFLKSGTARSQDSTSPGEDGVFSWQNVERWIAAGERPITDRCQDLFGRQSIATRLAQTAGVEGRPLALLGPLGSGKTTILQLARTALEPLEPPVIVAKFDVWAVPDPKEVPRLALNQIIAALDHHIDTIDLRTLPLTYQHLVAAEPTGRLERIFGIHRGTDSIDALAQLTPILEVLDARLLLIVEDVERAGRQFDTRHLERLLWALRQVERASFVVAADPARTDIDFSKLCDVVELIPSVDANVVATVLRVAYDHWGTTFTDIDPHRDRPDGGKLRLPNPSQGAIERHAGEFNAETTAIVSLLKTPRALKHVMTRVDRAWQNLHGEADIDDIIVIAALRYGAEDAYGFLLANIDAARQRPSALDPESKTVKSDWTEVIQRMDNQAAVQILVDLLDIPQLTTSPRTIARSPQGVHLGDPTDYFRRIVAEDIDPTELRDQAVLRDAADWQTTRDAALIGNLVAASETTERYPRVWGHFASIHSDEDLMELTNTVAARLLERDGPAAAGDHPALIALWLTCNRRPQRGQFKDWIGELILSSVPTSLSFVNDLYYYWTGQHGVIPDTERANIRAAIVARVRDSIRSGRSLAAVLSTRRPYAIMRLITQTDVDTSVAAYRAWRDYLPPLLIEGATQDHETITTQLATLAGDEQSGYRAPGPLYPPVFVRRYKIDRERMSVFFGELLDEALSLLASYGGDNEYAVRAKDDAKLWLKEREAAR